MVYFIFSTKIYNAFSLVANAQFWERRGLNNIYGHQWVILEEVQRRDGMARRDRTFNWHRAADRSKEFIR
jgi:hypothetical protein